MLDPMKPRLLKDFARDDTKLPKPSRGAPEILLRRCPFQGLQQSYHFLTNCTWQAQLADFVMNPACHSCSLDEDFIGRTACISRTVSLRIIAKRTLERYLVHIQLAWTRVGDGQEGE
jgi:hypothetical protein